MKKWNEVITELIDKKTLEVYHEFPKYASGNEELYNSLINELKKTNDLSWEEIIETIRILFVSVINSCINQMAKEEQEGEQEE